MPKWAQTVGRFALGRSKVRRDHFTVHLKGSRGISSPADPQQARITIRSNEAVCATMKSAS